MKKSLLDRFISKYNLGGLAESVLFQSQANKGLKTRFVSADQNLLGEVSCKSIELEDGEYGVYDTQQLRSLVGVLEDEIKIKVVKTGSKPTGFALSDTGTKVTFVLSDKSNIGKVPSLDSPPPYELTINIDHKFLNTFIRAKGALSEVETFTIISDVKKTDVVIGYSNINTNRVSFGVDVVDNVELDPISFSANYMREILLANKEMQSGTLKISSKGLAHVTFVIDDFTVDYHLVKVDRLD